MRHAEPVTEATAPPESLRELLGGRRSGPALLHADTRASWIWVLQSLIRVVIFGALWLPGSVVALGIARIALSWPLVAATIATSAVLFQRALPANHPGIRHPAG